MSVTKIKTDTGPAFSRRLRYKAWHMLMPAFNVKAGSINISIPATGRAASIFPATWPRNWRLALMRRLFALKKGAFIDIGANIGQTLIDYIISGENCGYFGFEPNPECLTLLSQIIERNGLRGIDLVPAGLADKNGILKFFVSKNSNADSGGSLLRDLRPQAELRSFYVPCYRFDDIREELGIDEISLIKIDVEGGELMTLSGMKETLGNRRPLLIVEVLHRNNHAAEEPYNLRLDRIMTLVQDVGYQLYGIAKTKDEGNVTSLHRLDDFPRATWRPENKSECDYLLVPRELITSVEGLRFP